MLDEPANIDVSLSGGVTIRWRDGHVSHLGIRRLRAACPCATCHDAALRPAPPPSPLPMYVRGATALVRVEPVGRYALQFHFNDGHSTGIYTWDHLRSLCECADCRPATHP